MSEVQTQADAIRSEIPANPFEAGMRLYETPRSEEDRDLVPEVRQILGEAGITEQSLSSYYDANRFVQGAVGRVPLVQRTQLNRFFSMAIQISPENTTALRSELIPQGPTDQWVDLIRNKVAPFLVEKKLME
jgi:hypothetical protein